MPELPEVETLRLQLSQLIIGKTIKSIDILKAKSFIGDKSGVIGGKIIRVRRFGKLLVIDFSNGLSLAVHLKMSGQLIFREQKTNNRKQKYIDPLLITLPNIHTRVILTFTNGDRLFFNDMRMFGWVRIVKNPNFKLQISNKTKNPNDQILNISDLICKLGPEPLRDLTLDKFKEILKRFKKPIKLVLMDQEKISGVGNIYANDALFLSGINPRKSANTLLDNQIAVLLNCLERVLKDGIKWGGASRNNFRDAYGEKGQVQNHFHVYDREGCNCPNLCGAEIKKFKLGGRGTFFCPICQKG